MIVNPTEIEKENLEAHVELCAQRYQSLETRLDTIEYKMTELQKMIQNSHQNMTRVIVGAAGTVVTGVLSLLVVILTKMA
jgi:tetrahydromethanopterin S-methyltransferase subunit G